MARKSKKQRKYEKAQKIKVKKQQKQARKGKQQQRIIVTPTRGKRKKRSYNLAGAVAFKNLEYELQAMPLKLANMFRTRLYTMRLEILHKIGKDNYNNKLADAMIGETILKMPSTQYSYLQKHPKDSEDAADEWGHDLLTLLTDNIDELKTLSEQLGEEYA